MLANWSALATGAQSMGGSALASERCKSRSGAAWQGWAGHIWAGMSVAGRGMARAADGSTEGQPSLLLSMGADLPRLASAWHNTAGRGGARQG
jgi:hypothetical protein